MNKITSRLPKKIINSALNRLGYQVQRLEKATPDIKSIQKTAFSNCAYSIIEKHYAQTCEVVEALRQKYREPVIGKIHVWDAMQLLGQCIDPSDFSLGCVSQLTHTLQVLSSMEEDGISDSIFLMSALLHDLGKILLLTDEAPENIVCFNAPIGEYPEAIGFDNCIFQWNHDEFAYSRLKDYVPDAVAWLIRHHSIDINCLDSVMYLMDDRDKLYTEKYLIPFAKHDQGSKGLFNNPKLKLEKYRDLIWETFPKPILI